MSVHLPNLVKYTTSNRGGAVTIYNFNALVFALNFDRNLSEVKNFALL